MTPLDDNGCGSGGGGIHSNDPVLDAALKLDAAYLEAMGQDAGATLADIESPYDDCDPEPDDDGSEGLDQCGMYADGHCSLVGTEWCDWSCPRGGLAA